jgi:hypothetical protein
MNMFTLSIHLLTQCPFVYSIMGESKLIKFFSEMAAVPNNPPKLTNMMPSSQLVAGCSRWWPENTAGHSPQRKIKRNIKTLQNPKAELLTSGWWLEDLETFLGITGNPRKKRNKEQRHCKKLVQLREEVGLGLAALSSPWTPQHSKTG